MLLPSATIRPATAADLRILMRLLQEKADFDRTMGTFSGVLPATPEKLQHTLFGEMPFAKVLLAERLGSPVGFALYYFRYSSFQARPSIWLDDLYLQPEARHQSIGTLLMAHLADVAQRVNCTHLAWTASPRNTSAIQFYEKIGGVITDQHQGLFYFQLSELSMQILAQPLVIAA